MPRPKEFPKDATWWITYVNRRDAEKEAKELRKTRGFARGRIHIIRIGSGKALNKFRKEPDARYVDVERRYAVVEI